MLHGAHRVDTRRLVSIVIAIQCLNTGCATVARSPSTQLLVASEPAGASVHVDDVAVGTTPVILTLRRRDANVIGLSAAGYAPATLALSRATNTPLLLGNLLLFHPGIAVAGFAVDMALGSHYTVGPTVNTVRLSPTEQAASGPLAMRAAWQPVPVGSTIRVRVSQAEIDEIGIVTGFAGDTLILAKRATGAVRIDRRRISGLDLGMGHTRASGALAGGVVGALSGCAAGYLVGRAGSSRDGHYNGGMACSFIGLPVGAAIGAFVGTLRAAHRWHRVF